MKRKPVVIERRKPISRVPLPIKIYPLIKQLITELAKREKRTVSAMAEILVMESLARRGPAKRTKQSVMLDTDGDGIPDFEWKGGDC